MFKKSLFLVVVILLAVPAFAEDVAMVTKVEGIVDAQIDGDGWSVEIAELLPDGVEIKVSSDGSLVIAHMLDNVEYSFMGGAIARISESGVEGSGFEKKSFELVSTGISLSESSTHQAGTADLGRSMSTKSARASARPAPSSGPPAPLSAPASDSDSFDESSPPQALEVTNDQAPVLQIAKKVSQEDAAIKRVSIRPEQVNNNNESIKSGHDSEKAISREEKDKSEEKAGREKKKMLSSAVTVARGLFVAIPASLLADKSGKTAPVSVIGFEAKDIGVVESKLGWITISIATSNDEPIKTVEVQAGEKVASVAVLFDVKNEYSMVNAWQLEKAGYLHQAAAFWLKMIDEKTVPIEKGKLHLKRIKNKIAAE